MIGLLVQKESTEYLRNRRLVNVAALTGLLLLTAVITSASAVRQQRRAATQAQSQDQASFVAQGDRNPHSAAHFGHMAYRRAPPLAVFDPGSLPYLGQVVWLEAHTRSPAMFRPAEDAPELSRLADLSVAGVLALLVPLVVFLAGASSFAQERQQGTLQQILIAGISMKPLFWGKVGAAATLGMAVCVPAIGASVGIASLAPGETGPADTLLRGAFLVVGYGVYALGLAAVAVGVSAYCRRPASAHVVLLCIWAVMVVVVPRVGASTAEAVFPTPDRGTFWAQAAEAVAQGRPARDTDAYRAAERTVLNRALGREVSAHEAASMPLNRAGLSLAVSEMLESRAHASTYRNLFATYAAQTWVRRLFALASPLVALRHLSSALCGTDISAHREFAVAAERQRNANQRKLNEDMMLNGAGQGFAYLAGPKLWTRIPEFSFRPASAARAIRAAWPDFAALFMWTSAALTVAWLAVRRQEHAEVRS